MVHTFPRRLAGVVAPIGGAGRALLATVRPEGVTGPGAGAPRRPWSWPAVSIPVALVLAVTAIGLVVPVDVHLGSLFISAPALMAAVSTALSTGNVAGLSLVAALVCDIRDGLLGSPILVVHVVTLLVVSLLLIAFCRSRERNRRETSRLRAISQAAQHVVLRPLPRRIADLEVASVYRAADALAEVGGDLYAAAKTRYGTRLLIGDVKGKGLAALDDAAAVLGAFREAAHQHPTLPDLAAALEESVRRHVAEAAETDPDAAERFITALLVEFPADGGVMRFVSCGHPLPLRVRDDAVTALTGQVPAPPLGLSGVDRATYRQEEFRYAPGDAFLLYTDGLAEARDRAGAFYSVTERDIPWRTAEGDPEALLQRVHDDLLHHTDGRLHDDVALVAVQCAPAC
ncbi:PP2C family protein-serine/threonine phosphatase [Streptomyces carpinensis]|uniref:PP2C family protein-serine/threonine phosphatase n=1 Tax=Streptomyces carpinensis TaxID=66369 RepID=A0ABV1W587_9ACTN|nr:PP2C family protein-serine/threonine phosphatase [Streptomyces carpinensis]